MKYLIVVFRAGDKGPISKHVEDGGAIVFLDFNQEHLYPARLGAELWVRITKKSHIGNARFGQIVGGPTMVARLRKKRRERVGRIIQRRIAKITGILKKDGMTIGRRSIVVEGITYHATASDYDYCKQRLCGKVVGYGAVYVEGTGLDSRGEDILTRITVSHVRFEGGLLNQLPMRDEIDDEIRRNHQPSHREMRPQA